MDIKVLKEYLLRCQKAECVATWEGLNEFKQTQDYLLKCAACNIQASWAGLLEYRDAKHNTLTLTSKEGD